MAHYRSVNEYLRETYGEKLYKLSLDGGFTCPNRDGTLGSAGCIFCNGSGDFAVSVFPDADSAVEKAKRLVSKKRHSDRYIAYFQNYTGTYAPVEYLQDLYFSIIERDDIAVLSVATRPDCIGDDVLDLLSRLNAVKPVWVELGLQTIHPESAAYIRRGYPLEVYDDAVARLKSAGIYVITHMIIGLPHESEDMIYRTASYIGASGADGIKFQLLHVLKDTDLAADYEAGAFTLPDRDGYIRLLEGCIARIPQDMTVHRLTGDGAKRNLIAPLWSADKKAVLNAINLSFDAHGVIQGSLFSPGDR